MRKKTKKQRLAARLRRRLNSNVQPRQDESNLPREIEVVLLSSEPLHPEPPESSLAEFSGADSIRLDFGSRGPALGVAHEAFDKAVTHVSRELTLEAGGLCLGRIFRNRKDQRLLINLEMIVPAETTIEGAVVQGVASLTLTAEAWRSMIEVSEKQFPLLRVIGWYHSHPGFGVFLSSMDLFIHNHFFAAPWQIAVVIDPKQKHAGFFARARNKLRQRNLQWSDDARDARPLSSICSHADNLLGRFWKHSRE